jgi:hypothetical protein
MSAKERERAHVIRHVSDRRMRQRRAGKLLDVGGRIRPGQPRLSVVGRANVLGHATLVRPTPMRAAPAMRGREPAWCRRDKRRGPVEAPKGAGGIGELLVNDAGLPYEILSIHRVFDPKADTFVADREPQSCQPGRVGGGHFYKGGPEGPGRGARQ